MCKGNRIVTYSTKSSSFGVVFRSVSIPVSIRDRKGALMYVRDFVDSTAIEIVSMSKKKRSKDCEAYLLLKMIDNM